MPEQESPAEKLITYVESQGVEFSRHGDADPDVFASFNAGGVYQHHSIESQNFQSYLRSLFFDYTKKPIATSAVSDVVKTLKARAQYDRNTPLAHVGLRVAGHPDLSGTLGGPIYIDLCNDGWQVVEIDEAGWRVIKGKKCPVKFLRSRGMESLPTPRQGGSLEMLRQLVNVHENQWPLLLGWLVSCFQPCGPYPTLLVTGEQGTAKSTLCKLIRQLVDPNRASARRLPRSERDAIISAANSHVLSYDNVDGLQRWLSDCFCSIATGSGFATRKLFTDRDEMIFSGARPIVLNGIADVGARPDFLSRAYVLNLQPISNRERKTESQLITSFDAKKSRIFGALLDGVSCAIKNFRPADTDGAPRMADAIRWATAAEPALGLRRGELRRALRYNHDRGLEVAVASNPVASAVVKLMTTRKKWSGKADALREQLKEIVGDTASRDENWPETNVQLGHAVKRIAPVLREFGIEVEHGKSSSGNDRITKFNRVDGGNAIPTEIMPTKRSHSHRIARCYRRHRDAMQSSRSARRNVA